LTLKELIKKEWLGKRKINIYILWKNNHYKFCWIQLLTDGSFSLGFEPSTSRFTEYGSAVMRSGTFTKHIQTMTDGNVNIREVIAPHVTFHSPLIQQRIGLVHFKGKNGIVDEWELDWFPVKQSQLLLCMYSGDIANLEKINKLKGRHEIATLPSNIQCVRMELEVCPLLKLPQQIHDVSALANIHGFCPNYILNCRFYPNDLVTQGLYMATDSWLSKS
jgi:hypothetical protein